MGRLCKRLPRMAAVMTLPERLDLSACKALLPELVALRGQDIELDGSNMHHLGAIGAQFLLSGRASWRRDAAAFALTGLGDSALRCLAGLGIAPEQVGHTRAETTP